MFTLGIKGSSGNMLGTKHITNMTPRDIYTNAESKWTYCQKPNYSNKFESFGGFRALLEGFEVPSKIRFVTRGFSRVCANPVQDMDCHGNIRLLVTVL